ncbi:MAG: flagellar basal body protein [Elusimicrobiales bacterium]|nr:flagellar basal body protein [Elusimicrobiales bacterium]
MSSLDISYSALEFARKKMEVVSENIAKADVAGYKRKGKRIHS